MMSETDPVAVGDGFERTVASSLLLTPGSGWLGVLLMAADFREGCIRTSLESVAGTAGALSVFGDEDGTKLAGTAGVEPV